MKHISVRRVEFESFVFKHYRWEVSVFAAGQMWNYYFDTFQEAWKRVDLELEWISQHEES